MTVRRTVMPLAISPISASCRSKADGILGGILELPKPSTSSQTRGIVQRTSGSRVGNQLAKRRKELARQLLCRGINEPAAKLSELTTDLGIDLVRQENRVRPLFAQRHKRTALCKPGDSAIAFS